MKQGFLCVKCKKMCPPAPVQAKRSADSLADSFSGFANSGGRDGCLVWIMRRATRLSPVFVPVTTFITGTWKVSLGCVRICLLPCLPRGCICQLCGCLYSGPYSPIAVGPQNKPFGVRGC